MIAQIHRNVSANDITTLNPNECFVFGSNIRGLHGKGAALTAYKLFGATWNTGIGPTGQCYAIPTKDEFLQVLSLGEIAKHIEEFLIYADCHLGVKFLVSAIGTGLAGYKPEDIAPLFFNYDLPPNVYLPESFWVVYDEAVTKGEIIVDKTVVV